MAVVSPGESLNNQPESLALTRQLIVELVLHGILNAPSVILPMLVKRALNTDAIDVKFKHTVDFRGFFPKHVPYFGVLHFYVHSHASMYYTYVLSHYTGRQDCHDESSERRSSSLTR